jgi:hypothetical protein
LDLFAACSSTLDTDPALHARTSGWQCARPQLDAHIVGVAPNRLGRPPADLVGAAACRVRRRSPGRRCDRAERAHAFREHCHAASLKSAFEAVVYQAEPCALAGRHAHCSEPLPDSRIARPRPAPPPRRAGHTPRESVVLYTALPTRRLPLDSCHVRDAHRNVLVAMVRTAAKSARARCLDALPLPSGWAPTFGVVAWNEGSSGPGGDLRSSTAAGCAARQALWQASSADSALNTAIAVCEAMLSPPPNDADTYRDGRLLPRPLYRSDVWRRHAGLLGP